MGRSKALSKGSHVYLLPWVICSHISALEIPSSRKVRTFHTKLLTETIHTDSISALKQHHSPELLVAPFCEILWRYLLVATPDQYPSLMFINNSITEISDIWDKSPKLVDLDDSRAILHAYNGRLAPADSRLYGPLPITAIPLLLKFVTPLVQAGSEDLLPSLVGLTLGRFWKVLLDNWPQEIQELVESVGGALHYFGYVFEIAS